MKIQLMSDLHFEWHQDGGAEFMCATEPVGEVLVLAGDITQATTPTRLVRVFSLYSKLFKHVVYVPGNHEFYGTTIIAGWENVKRAAEVVTATGRGCVHALNNECAAIDGKLFFGGVGWFPEPTDPKIVALKAKMDDFDKIGDIEPEAYLSRACFARELLALPVAPDVIVSHYLPTDDSVDERYAGDDTNAFFVSQFPVNEYRAPKLWLHGHTHEQVDVVVGDTRVVCNPLGYPWGAREMMLFQDKLVLEI